MTSGNSGATPSYPNSDIINICVMRHGEKQGDALTEKGIAQVEATAQAYLGEMDILYGLHTGKQRVIQSLEVVQKATGRPFALSASDDYNPWWAFDQNLPQYDVEALEAELVGASVYDLLRAWSPAWAMMVQMRNALKATAMQIWDLRRNGHQKRDMLVANHTWVAEMGVPSEFVHEARLMEPADVYRYDVQLQMVDRLRDPVPVIVGYEHLPCPLR